MRQHADQEKKEKVDINTHTHTHTTHSPHACAHTHRRACTRPTHTSAARVLAGKSRNVQWLLSVCIHRSIRAPILDQRNGNRPFVVLCARQLQQLPRLLLGIRAGLLSNPCSSSRMIDTYINRNRAIAAGAGLLQQACTPTIRVDYTEMYRSGARSSACQAHCPAAPLVHRYHHIYMVHHHICMVHPFN